MNDYGEREILDQMDPAVRQRVQSEIEKYAPFLGLLAAWKAAITEHVAAIEQRTLHRLMEQFFPQGEWRFPAQTIVVPTDLRYREVTMEDAFTDPITGATWTPCGHGWTLPSEITGWTIEQGSNGRCALILCVRHESRDPEAPLITPELGQLAFVWGDESLVAALANAKWAIQYPGHPFEPISVERYPGYLEFEREMGIARFSQRQLEPWLPPFHPYSRKFLHFRLSALGTEVTNPTEWAWLGESHDTIRMAALINPTTAGMLAVIENHSPLILNAIPVAQMSMLSQSVVTPLHTVGDAYKVSFAGLTNFFAAVARAGDIIHRVRFERTLAGVPYEQQRGTRALYDVAVISDQTVTEIKVYHDCLGEEATPGRDRPDSLIRPGGQNFSVPLPAVGGLNLSLVQPNDEGSRYYWYHSIFRPPLLTEGDILELLSHLPVCRSWFDLRHTTVQLDVVSEPGKAFSLWDTYLYPSLVSDTGLLTLLADHFTHSGVAIIPIMRLWFHPRRRDLPIFLLREAARYAASVISQYFMIGWYCVEGYIAED